MNISKKVQVSAAALSIGMMMLPALSADATEGYFQNGNGVRHKALAGAGVADTRDSTALAINPAGIIGIDRQLNLGITLFSPRRSFTGSGDPGFTATGNFKSDSNYFPIPDFSYASPIDENSAWGIAITANGGMNTDWAPNPRPLPDCPPLGGAGAFCGGLSGVNMSQAILSLTYARKIGNFRVGIAPLLAMNMFRVRGLAAFGGFSSDPGNLTDRGTDFAFGYGIKVGFQADLGEGFRIGGNWQSRIYMSKFDKYAGLFAEQGDFDIPMNFTLGLAFDASPKLTIMADYKKIYYSKIASIANSPFAPFPFGASNGPGFGWKSIDIFKLGIEYRHSDTWTWRAGFSKNDNPVGPEAVTINILAPGIVKTHITGGFAFKVSEKSTISFAAGYIPSTTVTGPEGPGGGFNPNHTVSIKMYQMEATIGWTRHF
ncbi:MAG: outer membrane protein transport protein [Proteobacteria bacterium]|nr:outer membrane protein transport protein [Pseudomonadota bacterium]